MTVVDIARELVRIPSVNPDGDPGTQLTGEAACAEWLSGFLSAEGAGKYWTASCSDAVRRIQKARWRRCSMRFMKRRP